MFFHIYKYRLKTILHTKDELFWVILFPILLGTCFYAAFSNVTSSTENFQTIDVAVVNTEDTGAAYFNMLMEALGGEDNDNALLHVTYTDADKAEELLKNDDVTGIIALKDGIPSLTFAENGISQSILTEIIDQYIQCMYVIQASDTTDIKMLNASISRITTNCNYIAAQKLTDGNTDMLTDYYFSLIAMASLYGVFLGQSCVSGIKANLSSKGMRKCLSPVNRMTLILGDFLGTCTIQVFANILLIIYLVYILKVNLGGKIPLIMLAAVFGSLIGIGFGMSIGSLPKLSDAVKNAILAAFSLFSSFLSGLMVGGIKYDIERTAPIINRLNPATIITDALYSLNIYDTYDRYLSCIAVMAIYAVVLCAISYFCVRRESYANI